MTTTHRQDRCLRCGEKYSDYHDTPETWEEEYTGYMRFCLTHRGIYIHKPSQFKANQE